jgi:hypothetical protein
MKLENIIRRALFEQRSGKLKTVPVNEPIPLEVPDIIPPVRRSKLKPANQKGLQIAQSHGAVLDAWSAFSIILNITKTGKETIKAIDSSTQATAAINMIVTDQGDSNYGPESRLARTGKSGIAKYMYIVGPNISKIKRVLKYNVWVCNYEQLYILSTKLNQTEPLQYYQQVTSNAARNKIGNIPVFMYTEAARWFQSLQARIDLVKNDTEMLRKSGINLKPENSNMLIPELEYLNTDYDPAIVPAEQSKPVEITDQNYKEYGNTGFRGIARKETDAMGNTIIIPVKGIMSVVRYKDGMPGRFEGDFINGAPGDGSVKWDDDSEETIKPGDTRIYTDSTGRRTFTFVPSNLSTKTQLSVNYKDTAEIIQLLQRDIKDMLINNPEWVNSFEKTKYYNSLQNFNANGEWDAMMRDVTLLLNAQFLGDAVIDPSTNDFYRGIEIEIPESVRQAILKYKSEKIPL